MFHRSLLEVVFRLVMCGMYYPDSDLKTGAASYNLLKVATERFFTKAALLSLPFSLHRSLLSVAVVCIICIMRRSDAVK